MKSLYEEIKNKATMLSLEERAKLAQELISSLDGKRDPDIENSWDEVIKKRVEQIKYGTAKGRLAETIHSEIRARYS